MHRRKTPLCRTYHAPAGLTRKFWLQPADVTRFKCQIIKHLPILIFGERCKLPEGQECTSGWLR